MSSKQRFYKFVGDRGFSRLPTGPIDNDAYQALPADLKHIVLHSGAYEPMTDAEIKKHKADIEAAAKAAEEEAAKATDQDAEKAAEEVKS